MNFKRFAFFILFLVACTPVFAQRDTIGLNTIVAKTTKLITSYPFEKVYLHLDKPYYAAGDTIWFKAYLLNEAYLTGSQLSGLLYMEFINEKNKLVKRLMFPVAAGKLRTFRPICFPAT